MDINNIKIIDIRKKFKDKFGFYRKIKLWKEEENRVYFYLRGRGNGIDLYYFDKEKEDIFHKVKVEGQTDEYQEFVELKFIDDYRLIYTVAGDSTLSCYEYDLITYDRREVFQEEADDLKLLDDRYGLLIVMGEDLINRSRLVDLKTGEIIDIKDKRMENTYYDNTRLVVFDARQYLVHSKYSLDNYDGEVVYLNDWEIAASGIYLIEYDRFLYELLRGKEELSFKAIMESDGNNSHIDPVVYSSYKECEDYRHSYHFTKIDYGSKEFSLYQLRMKAGELDYELLKTISYDKYGSCQGLKAHSYPVIIEKTSKFGLYNELRTFYPMDCSQILDGRENEYLAYSLDDIVINNAHMEDDRSCYNFIRIRDKHNGRILMEIRGEGILLSDSRSLLIYEYAERINSSLSLESEKGHSYLLDIFKKMNNRQLEYNWLITDMEVNASDQELFERLSGDYLFLTGEELTEMVEREDFQWIWGVLSGFHKSYREEDILAYDLPRVRDSNRIFRDSVLMGHPHAEVEIIAYDSSNSFIISKNRELISDIKANDKGAIDLEFKNRIFNYQRKYIEECLLKNDSLEEFGDLESFNNKVLEIWETLFKDDALNPYLLVTEEDILKAL